MRIEEVIHSLIVKSEFDKAKSFIELALSVDPKNASLRKNLSVVLIHLGDIEGATALLNDISRETRSDPDGDSLNVPVVGNYGQQEGEDDSCAPEEDSLDYQSEDHTLQQHRRSPSELVHSLVSNEAVDDLEEEFDDYWVPDVERKKKKRPLTTITSDLFDPPQAMKANNRREELLGKATLWATRISIEFGLNPTDREHLEKAIETVPKPHFLASLSTLLGNGYRAPEIYLAACFIAYWEENLHLSDSALDSESHFFMPESEKILDFVRSYRSIPQVEEMLRFIELAYGEWSTNLRIKRRYPVFFECLQECARQADDGPASPDALS
jgi:tetratricopeptide (TPR) repeat protein